MKGDAEVDDMVSKSFGALKLTEEIEAITDRQFLMRLDSDNFLDCSDYLTEDNTGVFIADGFSDALQNVVSQAYMVGEDFMPIVAYFATRKLIANEELYNRYGKYFWCYEDNFKTLNRKQNLYARSTTTF